MTISEKDNKQNLRNAHDKISKIYQDQRNSMHCPLLSDVKYTKTIQYRS